MFPLIHLHDALYPGQGRGGSAVYAGMIIIIDIYMNYVSQLFQSHVEHLLLLTEI